MASTIPCRKCGAPAVYSHSDRRGDVHKCTECTNFRGEPTTTYYDADYRDKHGRSKGSYEEQLGIPPLEDGL